MKKAPFINVALFNQNDPGQIALVYERNYQDLYYYARKLVKDPEVAYDIVSQAFLNLINKKNKRYRSGANISYELSVITRNLCISYLRRTKKLKEILMDISYTQELSNPIADLCSIETGVIAQLYEQLNKLSPQRRQVIEMIYLKGMSRQQIADELGISPETVKNHALAALKRLRNVLPLPGQWDVLITIIIILMTWKN